MNLLIRILISIFLISSYSLGSSLVLSKIEKTTTETALQQLDSQNSAVIRQSQSQRNAILAIGWLVVLGISFTLVGMEVYAMIKKSGLFLLVVLSLTITGCWRPFEPIKLEVIQTNEEAFLLPFNTEIEKQSSTHTEDYLRQNLVHTQQVQLPQQWVQKGFETFGANGEWRDAAILVRVDKSPVTREWTADANTGTSNKNEAIWVMTADQVEFSTGWTCTARIASRDDAVKFLHHYPNGSLAVVMDTELRAKLQASFGLEVTDLPMDELRKQATPHIQRVCADVSAFFAERGITVTNIGITGGFVYKDPTIIATMVRVFNAEQEKSISIAQTAAEAENAKKLQITSEIKAKAIMTEKKAEADGIVLVADAKAYEIGKAKEDSETYLKLKHIELERAKLEKWDGKFPTYFMGGANPNLLLQIPEPK